MCLYVCVCVYMCECGSVVMLLVHNAKALGSIPGLGKKKSVTTSPTSTPVVKLGTWLTLGMNKSSPLWQWWDFGHLHNS